MEPTVEAIVKRWMRPVVYPPLHAWQRLHDFSRTKLRQCETQWRDFHGRRAMERAIARDGSVVVQDVHGIRFVLYPFDRPKLLQLMRRIYDAAEFEAVPRLVRPGDVAIDIGANAGMYSVLLSQLCGPAGRVWSFEPVPETYWRLRETLALNRCENVVPVQAAVCAEPGGVLMNLFEPEFAEWNTLGRPTMLRPDGEEVTPHKSIEVTAQTLDQFCGEQGIERVNFLKVDVEGFELAVFQGAERMLMERRVDSISFEISQRPLRAAGVESFEVFAALERYGYTSYRFDRATQAFCGPVRDTSEEWANFFASWRDLSDPRFAAPGRTAAIRQ